MAPDWGLTIELGGPLLAVLLTAVIQRAFEYRSRLITYLSHVSAFPLPLPAAPPVPQGPAAGPAPIVPAAGAGTAAVVPVNAPQQAFVYSHSILVRNTGKKTAFNVRIGHIAMPLAYQVAPTVTYKITTIPGGGWEILIPTLVPNEQVQVAYLYFPPMTWSHINSYTKSDESLAEGLNVVPMQQPSLLMKTIAFVLLYLGIATAAYLMIVVTQWIYAVGRLSAST